MFLHNLNFYQIMAVTRHKTITSYILLSVTITS